MTISLFFGLAVVGTFSFFEFRSFLYSRSKNTLVKYASLAESSFDVQKFLAADSPYLNNFTKKISSITGCRVSVINAKGRVLADSEVPPGKLPQVENHLYRPEIQQSLQEKFGFNIRRSATIGKDLLYLSRAINLEGRNIGFLRLALFTKETNQLLARVRNYFIGGGLLVLLISALLVRILSLRINRDLDEIIQKAGQIASGNFEAAIHVHSKDELSDLGENLNEMAAKLSKYLHNLTRERHDLNTVLSSIDEGIIAIGPDKKIIFFNEKALLFSDCKATYVKGNTYSQIVGNRHLQLLLNKYFKKPSLISDEIHIGKERILETIISPFTIEGKIRKGAVVVLRDISHYKKLEKIRKDFVANVSHEFKTPLAAILGYSETLLDWGLEDNKVNRKYVEKIIKQSHNLENLVTDLLELARIERLQAIEMRPFDPRPVIQKVLNEYSEVIQTNHLKLTTDIPSQKFHISGEKEMFRSILVNLIDNAVKYTPPNGIISVMAKVNKGTVTFSVKDSGIGITEEEQVRIFERFYRIDKARSRSKGGTGLGLSIVKHLAELQKAEVWVNSQVNKGSCFSVKFQLVKPPVKLKEKVQDS